jgi:hypothetical protein
MLPVAMYLLEDFIHLSMGLGKAFSKLVELMNKDTDISTARRKDF